MAPLVVEGEGWAWPITYQAQHVTIQYWEGLVRTRRAPGSLSRTRSDHFG